MPLEISLLQLKLIAIKPNSSPVDSDNGVAWKCIYVDLQILLGNILIYNRKGKLQSFIVLQLMFFILKVI